MRPASPRPRRPDPRGGRRQDTQLEAMILCKKLRADDRRGEMEGPADPWLDGQARMSGFHCEEDKLAWMSLLDDTDNCLDDYEELRNEVALFGGLRAGSSARSKTLMEAYGSLDDASVQVQGADNEPHAWSQSGLQAIKDACGFAAVLRMLPGDSCYRAQLLSNERVGSASWLTSLRHGHGKGGALRADGTFIQALRNLLCVPVNHDSPDPTRIYKCSCGKKLAGGRTTSMPWDASGQAT